ncbi:MAG: hypothetical protein Q8P67_13070 [archaeon]|nr:hypothetical protein [archaeon]
MAHYQVDGHRNAPHHQSPRSPRDRHYRRSPSPPGRYPHHRQYSPPPPMEPWDVCVGNLSRNLTREHLFEIFGSFGRVTEVNRPLNNNTSVPKKFAYITYGYEEDACEAVRQMDGGQIDGLFVTAVVVAPPRYRRSPSPPRGGSRGRNSGFSRSRGPPPSSYDRGALYYDDDLRGRGNSPDRSPSPPSRQFDH